MCEPLSIAAVTMMAVSAAASAYAQKQAARNAEKGAKYNARMARIQAMDAAQRGQYEEYVEREKVGALVGHQRALIGGSGAAVGEGAPARIIEDTEALGQLKAVNIRNNAMREAWGYESQAIQFGFEAEMAEDMGRVGVATSLLGGAAQSVGLAAQLKKA